VFFGPSPQLICEKLHGFGVDCETRILLAKSRKKKEIMAVFFFGKGMKLGLTINYTNKIVFETTFKLINFFKKTKIK